MPNNIDLLANEGMTLGSTLEGALEILRERAIPVIGAAQILELDRPSRARIVLRDSCDKVRAAKVLVAGNIELAGPTLSN
jgi:hypothetical protein